MNAEAGPALSPRPLMDQYLNYLLIEKGLAANTLDAYRTDLDRFADFLHAGGIRSLGEADSPVILKHLIFLRDSGMGPRSRARHLVTLRGFFKFLIQEKILEKNPATRIDLPKSGLKLPDVLSVQEIDRILNLPDANKPAAHSKRGHDRADVRRRTPGVRAGDRETSGCQPERLLRPRLWKRRQGTHGAVWTAGPAENRFLCDNGQAASPSRRCQPLPVCRKGRKTHDPAGFLENSEAGMRRLRESPDPSRPTACAIPLPAIFWKAGRICGRFRSCWGTWIFQPPRSIPMWRGII